MEYTLTNLIKHSSDTPELQRQIARAIIRFSQFSDERGVAAEAVGESIKLDVLILESLVNPDKFDYEDVEIGSVVV
jgi:hypothetical protein